MRIKRRYIIAAAIILLSVAVTPYLIELAYLERGFKAYGGEYMIIPLGIVLAASVLSFAADWDKERRRKSDSKVQPVRTDVKDTTLG